MFIKSVIFLIILGFTLTAGQSEGDSCYSYTDGVCIRLSECPSVIADRSDGESYRTCGFQGSEEIVCCPYGYGTTTHRTLIVGGEVARVKEFSHMALVGFVSSSNETHWGCGGTLISNRYVLTAAHCLNSRELGEPQFVRLGAFDINIINDPHAEDFNIEQIIPHPDWRSSSKYNDIGLLKLKGTVNLNQFKKIACLPLHFDGPENSYIATGWGDTKYAGSGSQQLRKVTLEKFSHSECNEIYSKHRNRKLRDGIRNDTQLCAGSKTEQKDTCQGDSGGPLQVRQYLYRRCMYTIIGITSFGAGCGNIGVPGIYTRVFPYAEWIKNTIYRYK